MGNDASSLSGNNSPERTPRGSHSSSSNGGSGGSSSSSAKRRSSSGRKSGGRGGGGGGGGGGSGPSSGGGRRRQRGSGSSRGRSSEDADATPEGVDDPDGGGGRGDWKLSLYSHYDDVCNSVSSLASDAIVTVSNIGMGDEDDNAVNRGGGGSPSRRRSSSGRKRGSGRGQSDDTSEGGGTLATEVTEASASDGGPLAGCGAAIAGGANPFTVAASADEGDGDREGRDRDRDRDRDRGSSRGRRRSGGGHGGFGSSHDDDTLGDDSTYNRDDNTYDGEETASVYTDDDNTLTTNGDTVDGDEGAGAGATISSNAADMASALLKQKPLASSFAKKCHFTKVGVGKTTQHYEGLTMNGNVIKMLAKAMSLKGCPTICDEDLRRVEIQYPNQFSRLPDELLLSSGWKRISKFCHFSNRPIPDGVPFFHSREKIHPNTGGYYFLLASAIGMTTPDEVEQLSRDHLVVLETDFPQQADAAPRELMHNPDMWVLVDKFCFFSGGPINCNEDVYYQTTVDGNRIYMLAFLSPAMTPEQMYRTDEEPRGDGGPDDLIFHSTAAVMDVERVYDLTPSDFDDLKLYHLGPWRALPPDLLLPDRWEMVFPEHFLHVRQQAFARAERHEAVHGPPPLSLQPTQYENLHGQMDPTMLSPQQQSGVYNPHSHRGCIPEDALAGPTSPDAAMAGVLSSPDNMSVSVMSRSSRPHDERRADKSHLAMEPPHITTSVPEHHQSSVHHRQMPKEPLLPPAHTPRTTSVPLDTTALPIVLENAPPVPPSTTTVERRQSPLTIDTKEAVVAPRVLEPQGRAPSPSPSQNIDKAGDAGSSKDHGEQQRHPPQSEHVDAAPPKASPISTIKKNLVVDPPGIEYGPSGGGGQQGMAMSAMSRMRSTPTSLSTSTAANANGSSSSAPPAEAARVITPQAEQKLLAVKASLGLGGKSQEVPMVHSSSKATTDREEETRTAIDPTAPFDNNKSAATPRPAQSLSGSDRNLDDSYPSLNSHADIGPVVTSKNNMPASSTNGTKASPYPTQQEQPVVHVNPTLTSPPSLSLPKTTATSPGRRKTSTSPSKKASRLQRAIDGKAAVTATASTVQSEIGGNSAPSSLFRQRLLEHKKMMANKPRAPLTTPSPDSPISKRSPTNEKPTTSTPIQQDDEDEYVSMANQSVTTGKKSVPIQQQENEPPWPSSASSMVSGSVNNSALPQSRRAWGASASEAATPVAGNDASAARRRAMILKMAKYRMQQQQQQGGSREPSEGEGIAEATSQESPTLDKVSSVESAISFSRDLD